MKGRLLQPAPYSTTSDLVDRAFLKVEKFGQFSSRDRRLANCADLPLVQLRAVGAATPKASAVLGLVSDVFFCGRPSEVVRSVIQRVAVIVRGVVLCAGSRAMERLAHKAMYRGVLHFPIRIEDYTCVASTSAASAVLEKSADNGSAAWTGTRRVTPHLPQVGDAVVRGSCDCNPKFGRIIRFSHSALLSHCGQGRAVFPAPFRPADFSRSSAEQQRKAA